MKHRNILLVAFLFALATGNAAEVFTNTGPDGERVYTDKPQADSRKIELRIAGPQEEETPDAKTEPAFADLAPCARARFVLDKYENAETLAEKTEDGGTRMLSPQETAAKIQQARGDVERLCKEVDDE